jgi:tRNA(Ile)-lysidine synthase
VKRVHLLGSIAQTIERHAMLARGMKLGVAVSGGADSVCLLHVLLELAPRWQLRLSVLHLDHKLRGEESAGDAEFVRELAGKLGLPVTIREQEIVAGRDNLEQAARRARLAFFRERIACGALDRVATGHTRSDQAETVLYRILRGAATAGLAGIRPIVGGQVIRPLIEVDRSEAIDYLLARGLTWREDSSNTSPRFARNRIRHELLPGLARDWNPAIGRSLAHLADWAQAEESWWGAEIDRLAGEYLIESHGSVLVRADALMRLPLAPARRLVRRAIETVKGDLRGVDFEHIGAVLALAGRQEGRGRCHLPGVEVRRSFDWLCFALPDRGTRGYCLPVEIPGSLRIPFSDSAISMELLENSETSPTPESVYNGGMACLDWEQVAGSVELRSWRPGDRYRPVGRSREEKLKALFQEARIPSWERRLWPILTAGGSILWTRRFGAAARYAAHAGSGVVMRIRETQC